MQLPQFMFVESPELEGAAFMLSTTATPFIAKVLKFNNDKDFQTFKSNTKNPYSLINGYRVAVQYYTAFNHDVILSDISDLSNILDKMAIFYLEHRITPKSNVYKRYLL